MHYVDQFCLYIHNVHSVNLKKRTVPVLPFNVQHFKPLKAVKLKDGQTLLSTRPLLTFHFSFLGFFKAPSSWNKISVAKTFPETVLKFEICDTLATICVPPQNRHSHIQAASNIQTINPLVGAVIILEQQIVAAYGCWAFETNANIFQS